MKTKICLFVSLISALSIVSCHAQQANTLDSFINKTGDSLYKSQKVPGIFIGVLNGSGRKYYHFGYADTDKKTAFDTATVFEIGSITKTFTAYVLQSVLKEKGINDSTAILSYLPDSVQKNKALGGITFLSLVNHTSGLVRVPENMDPAADPMAPYDHYITDDLFSYLKNCTPKPDGKSNYSNLGAGLAGVVAERISGKTYKALLQEYIFLPFNITYHADESISHIINKSQGYFEDDKADYWNMNVLAPAGTLKSSAMDMLTYLQCMSTPVNDRSKQIIDKLSEPTVSVRPVVKVCRAWHTYEQKDKPVIYWHNGGTYGFSTFGAFIKGENKAVIVVVNQFNKNAVSDGLGIAIMKKLLEN